MSTSGIDIRVLFTGTVLIFVELFGPLDTYIFGYFFFRLLSLKLLINFVLLWARRLR